MRDRSGARRNSSVEVRSRCGDRGVFAFLFVLRREIFADARDCAFVAHAGERDERVEAAGVADVARDGERALLELGDEIAQAERADELDGLALVLALDGDLGANDAAKE